VLERAGVDHDVFDETTLSGASVSPEAAGTGAVLRIADETYRTVVLPGPAALSAAAARTLVGFAEAGGRVVCVGTAPELFLGAQDGENTPGGDLPPEEEGDTETAALFSGAVARGLITLVDSPEQVPAVLARSPLRITADAPHLLRAHGDLQVLALVAHDEETGTRAPVVALGSPDWTAEGNFPWAEYWRQLREDGYTYVPSGGRTATVRVEGRQHAPRAQRWDPGTGERTELDVAPAGTGGWRLDVPFEDGAVALVVLGDVLPPPTRKPLGPVTGTVGLDGPWRALAVSTLDNDWGDLAAADRPGTLPVEVWRMEHRTADSDAWQQVTAGFGPFALTRRGDGAPEWAEWSLSRGIRNDPVHDDRLGPKGYVPEEFLDWRDVPAGGEVSVRTHMTLPSGAGPLHLAVGANAARRVRVDGEELSVEGEGYQTFSPLPAGARGRDLTLDLELRALEEGPVRASFAVVTDPAAFRHPEWLTAGTGEVSGRTHELTLRAVLDRIPEDPTVHVSSDGACTVVVNGFEVGRQGDFNPYPDHREVRVHPYDIGARLRTGENTLTLRVTDAGGAPTACALDSTPAGRGGLGWTSDASWTATLDGAGVPLRLRPSQLGRDPRFRCGWARPHPLPGAHWLEPAAAGGGVVEPVVPDLAPGPERVEWLRFTAPLGTTALRVPTALRTTVLVDGVEQRPDGEGWVRLSGPLAAGTRVLLRVEAVDGRRGGALLDTAVEAEVAEAEVPLVSWEELGLRALGGEVRYRTGVHLPAAGTGRALLDLGEVRGTAEVLVNGVRIGHRVWGPYAVEVTGALRDGDNDIEVVVRGTLAGYLDDASPTRAIAAGQARTGLFGPVRLLTTRLLTTRQ
jgi:hypothetical protein